MNYAVWMEGYSATGNEAPARLLGSAQADSFAAACAMVCAGDPYFDSARLTVWGCRLFDNEAEARSAFG